jgi:hypothetical protein
MVKIHHQKMSVEISDGEANLWYYYDEARKADPQFGRVRSCSATIPAVLLRTKREVCSIASGRVITVERKQIPKYSCKAAQARIDLRV